MKKRWIVIGLFLCMICLGKVASFSTLYAESIDDGLIVSGWTKDGNGNFEKTIPYTGIEKIKLSVTVNDGYVINNAYDDPANGNSKNVAIMNKNLDVWIIVPGKKDLFIETKDMNGTITKHTLSLTVEGISAQYEKVVIRPGDRLKLVFQCSDYNFTSSTRPTGNITPSDLLTFDSATSSVNVPNMESTANLPMNAKLKYTYETYTNTMDLIIKETKPAASEFSFEGINVNFAYNSPLNSSGTMIGKLNGPSNTDYYSIKKGDGSSQSALAKVLPYSLGNYIKLTESLTVGTHSFQISLSGGSIVSGSATIPFNITVTPPSSNADWLDVKGTINDAGWAQEKITLTPSAIAKEYGYTKLSIDDTSFHESVSYHTEGSNNVKVVFQNDQGENSSPIYQSICIDLVNPVVESAVYDKENHQIHIKGTDSTSGIASYFITVKDNKTNTTIVASDEVKDTDINKSDEGYQAVYTLPSEHDDLSVEITAKDQSGRSSEVKTVSVSNTPDVEEPTPVASWISTDVNADMGTGWFTSYPTLSLSQTAKAAGYTKLRLSTETDSTETLVLASDTKDGVDVIFTNDDQSKISEALHIPYKIDTTNPTTGVIELADESSVSQKATSRKIHISADDVTSGLSHINYTIKDENGNVLRPETKVIFTAAQKDVYVPSIEDQIFQVEVIVFDHAGNQSIVTPVTLSTKETQTPDEPTKDIPTTSWISVNETAVEGWYPSAITLSPSDEAKTLGYTKLGITTMDASLQLLSEGTNSVSIVFEKADGTRSKALSYEARIDTIEPSIDDIRLMNSGDSLLHYISYGLLDARQVIQIQGDDASSGIKEIEYTIQDTDTKDWIVASRVEQAVGNAIEIDAVDDVNMEVCAKATDYAGHTTSTKVCKTVSTKTTIQKVTSIKDARTGIELQASSAIFEKDDVLEVIEIKEMKETLASQLHQDQQKMIKGYRISWMRDGQPQQLTDSVQLKLPTVMLKNAHLYVEQSDGTYERKEAPIIITTLKELILTQDDTQIVPDPIPTPKPEPEPKPDPITELSHIKTGWKINVDEENIFTPNTKLSVIDQTNTSTANQKQRLKQFIKGDYDIKKIQYVEITGIKATPKTYHIFIPAENNQKALFLIPKADGYVQKILTETDGYYKLETASLGLFVELQPNKVDGIVKPTAPEQPNNQGTPTITPSNQLPATDVTIQPSSTQKDATSGAKTYDNKNRYQYYIFLCVSISLLVMIGYYQKHPIHVTKRDI